MPPAEQSGRAATHRAALIGEAKAELRTALRLRRAVRTPAERHDGDAGRLAALIGLLEPALAARQLGMVATYFSRPDEPDTLQLIAWLAAHDVPALLPVVSAAAPSWALYTGPDALRIGRHQITEPTSAPLGAAGLGAAAVVICPALAVSRTGARLGQGSGWFDRALDHARPDVVTAALVDDDEVLGSVPTELHDHRMDMIITGTQVLNAHEPAQRDSPPG